MDDSKIAFEPNTGCWLWLGELNADGYGRAKRPSGKRSLAHRISYEESVGPIPDGLVLDHKCRQRSCVNPQHLEPVTIGENIRRSPLMVRRRGKSHCLHGHEMTPENIVLNGNAVSCRKCRVETNRRLRAMARKRIWKR